MGATCTKIDEPQAQQPTETQMRPQTTTKIDTMLEREYALEKEKIKMLLLGAGESGKSTIFKQMRILYGSPLSEETQKMYGCVVRSNTVVAIRKLCTLLKDLGFEEKIDEESKAATLADQDDASGMTPRQAYDQIYTYIVDMDNNNCEPFPEPSQFGNDWVGYSRRVGLRVNEDAKQFLQHVEAIRILWQCQTMREVWQKRSHANVIDSHYEFLQNLTRIADPEYRPTEYDIILCRIRTTQVTVERYNIQNMEFEVYDIGGQRSERRKWIDCFAGVNAVIFVAALSEYDQYLSESNKPVNRMIEALDLFDSVVKNHAFADTAKLLFLNKKDVFEEKIEYSDISAVSHFSDYGGKPKDYDQGILYFIQKFQDRLVDQELDAAFIHVTSATSTSNMKFVLETSRTAIMRSIIDDVFE